MRLWKTTVAVFAALGTLLAYSLLRHDAADIIILIFVIATCLAAYVIELLKERGYE